MNVMMEWIKAIGLYQHNYWVVVIIMQIMTSSSSRLISDISKLCIKSSSSTNCDDALAFVFFVDAIVCNVHIIISRQQAVAERQAKLQLQNNDLIFYEDWNLRSSYLIVLIGDKGGRGGDSVRIKIGYVTKGLELSVFCFCVLLSVPHYLRFVLIGSTSSPLPLLG